MGNANDALRDVSAGSIGGAVSIISSQPWDVIKVRFQTQKYRGSMMNCLIEIAKKEGVKGLYKGMAFPLYGQIAVNATVFGTEGFVQRLLPESKTGLEKLIHPMISGAAAGAVQSLICSPMELVKISMQLKNVGEKRSADYRGPVKEANNIWRQGGVRGIFSGLWVTTIRDSTGFAAYIASYDGLQRLVANAQGLSSIDDILLPPLMIVGGTAGCISWVVNYPIEIIKTLLQEDTIKESIAKEKGQPYKKRYAGIVDCGKKIVAKSGVRGLYGGLGPCLVRAFFNSCTLLPAMTYTKRYWPW